MRSPTSATSTAAIAATNERVVEALRAAGIESIALVDNAGLSLDGKQPSAETMLHTSLYSRYEGLGSVLHTHSPAAVLASRLFTDAVVLKDQELLKALQGIHTHKTEVIVPIFENNQDIDQLADEVDGYLAACDESGTSCYGYIIAGHGLYTWGESVSDALRHIEALEFLLTGRIARRG